MYSKSNTFKEVFERIGLPFAKSVITELFYLLASVFLSVLIVLWLIVCLPIFLFRFGLKYAARKWCPDLGEMLTVPSAMMAVDDIYGKPTAGIITTIELDGELTEELMKTFINRQLNTRNSKGEICYPEFKQYIIKWFGFYFFKHVQNFDIQNYYSFHHGNKEEEFHEKDLGKFVSDWLVEPFPKFQSQWSYRVINNFRPAHETSAKKSNKSLILLRHHHALGDGFSLVKMFNQVSDEPIQILESSGSLSKLGSWKLISQMLLLPLVTPYRLFRLFFESFDRNEWHQSEYSNEICYTIHPRIPVTRLKEIKERYNVSSISVVILAAFAGTVRRAMVSEGVKVPDMVHLAMPFPIPGHPEVKLVNHAGVTLIGLPVGIPDPVKRLEAMNQIVEKAIKDPTPLIFFRLSLILCAVFHWLVRPYASNYYSTVNASSLPGPKKTLKFNGFKVTDTGYFVGNMMGNPGVLFNTLTYNGYLRISFGLNKELLSKLSNPCLDDMAAGFGKEIDTLWTVGEIGTKIKLA